MERKKILIVEDNDFVRMQIAAFLSEEEYDIKESTNGEDALKVMDEMSIDLALVDLRMEPMGGFDFVKRIRNDGDLTPIMVITGDDNSDILSQVSKLDIFAVLKKPVAKERLIKSVSRILSIENVILDC